MDQEVLGEELMSTNLDMIRDIREVCDYKVPLRPFDKIVDWKWSDEKLVVRLECFRYETKRGRTVLTAKGTRLWRISSDGSCETFVVWDEEFTPVELSDYGVVYEGKSWESKRDYERSCFRPGNERIPLDNYGRVLAAPTSAKMERYW